MADFQGEILGKQEEALKKGGEVGAKFIAYIFNKIPKFPEDFPIEPTEKFGKMSRKNLVRKGAAIEDIPIDGKNIGDFKSIARKYGVDYSLKKEVFKDVNGIDKDKIKFVVYFKAKDKNIIAAALKDYGKKKMERAMKPTIKQKLEKAIQALKSKDRELFRTKNKTKEQSL